MEIVKLTALELSSKIRAGELTAPEAVEALAQRVKALDGSLNCYVGFDVEKALERAENAQKMINAGGAVSLLAGVPIAVKDNICTKGEETTCASNILKGFVPPYNATVIEKLLAAGAVPCGKTNMDEFAMGSTTETSAFGVVKNPWNTSCVAGGSSGGSAAAVAADEAFAALGSDTGGSVRQPCAFCNVTGLKSTYGAVSRYGLIAYASSLEQVGVIGKNAADTAALFGIISGRDERDLTSVSSAPVDLNSVINAADLKGKKIGIPTDFFDGAVDSDVAETVLSSVEVFRSLGAEAEHFSMPLVRYAVPVYYVIACAEASSNLSRYDGVKYGFRAAGETLNDVYVNTRSQGFGQEAKKRIMLGNFVLSGGYYDEYYKKALQAKGLITAAFNDALKKYDYILSPVAPSTAMKIGQGISNPLQMYLGDVYTVMANITGLPALALPCGFSRGGMPVGFQLIGRAFGEQPLLEAGNSFQRVTDYHLQKPEGRCADEL